MSVAEHEGRKPAADYLDHLGLSSDPFEPGLSPLFEGGQRRELLAEVLRHCQFSTSVLAVVGEPGVGKSCFRHALAERLESGDRISVVDVPLLSDAEQLLMHIAEQFGLPDTAARQSSVSVASWLAAIREFLEQPVEGDPLSVLIVENAHNLDDESLSCLVQLSEGSGGSHGLPHLVLVGEPELASRMRNPQQQGRSTEIFTLEPLSLADLKSYLRFRLEAAGFEGIFPFGSEDMQYLWQSSRGIPAAVHEPAREMLMDLAQPPPEPESLGLPVGHIVAMTVLVAGLLIALFYRAGEPSEGPAAGLPEGSDARPIAAPEPRQLSDQALQEQEQLRRNLMPPLTSEQAGALGTEQPRASGDELASDGGAATSAENLAKATGSESALGSRSTSTETVAPTPGAPPAAPLADDETTLLGRSPERFTLQVSAAASRESVEEFVRTQPNRADLLVFTARRDGKTLHIVVAGDYPTIQAARSAISELPVKQRQASPWPRLLRDVQSEIRQYRSL